MNTLEKILATKRTEIKVLYDGAGLKTIQDLASQAPERPSFHAALKEPGLSLIAEIKKASPSKGVIRNDFDPDSLANSFESQGASALSVLTDTTYFSGSIDHLTSVSQAVSLPILRKDFIIDPIQVYEAKAIGASAILLIKAALEITDCQNLLNLATMIGLDVLVEIHSDTELDACRSLSGPFCLGVNNRDLTTLKVDPKTSKTLYPKMRDLFGPKQILVAESGYHQVSDLESLAQMGFNAVLIGEGLAVNIDLLNWFK